MREQASKERSRDQQQEKKGTESKYPKLASWCALTIEKLYFAFQLTADKRVKSQRAIPVFEYSTFRDFHMQPDERYVQKGILSVAEMTCKLRVQRCNLPETGAVQITPLRMLETENNRNE